MKKPYPALLGALLSACTAGPDYSRPETAVPSSYAEPHLAAVPSEAQLGSWWTAFGDPELDRLIGRALAQNLDIATAASRIREARAEERVAGASALPSVTADSSITHQRISEHAIPLPPTSGGGGNGAGFGLPGSEFTTFRVGFDASWELDLFGKTRREIEAARARTGAAIWSHRDAEVSTAAEVASAYLALRSLQEQIGVAQSEVERQERSLKLVSARVRGGLVTGQDLEQQSAELSSAKAAVPPLRAEAEAQIHKIAVLTGDTPQALIAELGPAAASLPSPPEVPAGLPSDLLRRRPDIRAAERNLAAASAEIGVATADLYPRFSLSAAPALVSTALATLLEWGSRNFSGGAAVDWPIFNAGRTRARIDVRTAQQEQALLSYRKTILSALKDVEDSLARIDNDRRELGELEGALKSASRAEEIARTRYSGGLVTYSDVLQAQSRRIGLEMRALETRGAEARDTVALYKALGGGWTTTAQEGAEP
ncbi:MAG TPA: efflux transporter outer membrane subunit [Sphingomicrobium sp.]|nr:efflux transporter outer membrane subunit [Sphingomicrobium sp.]